MEGHAQTLAALEAAAPADTAAVYHGKGASKGMPQTPAAALLTASLDSKAIGAQVQAAQPAVFPPAIQSAQASVPRITAGESPTTFAPLARPKPMEAQAQTLAAPPAFPPASQAAHTAASHATFASQAGNVTQSTPIALESPATLPPPGEPKPLMAAQPAAFPPASEATSTPPQLASPESTLALGRHKPMEAQASTVMTAQPEAFPPVSQAANLARSTAVTAHPAPGQEGVPGPAGRGEASVPPPPSFVEVTGTTLTTKAVAMVAPLSPANVAPVAGVTKIQAQTFQTPASPANQPPVAMPNAAMLAAPQSPGAEAQTLTPNPHTMFFKLPQPQEPAPSVPTQQQTTATLAPVGASAAPSAPTQHQTPATEFTQQQSPATLAPVGASMAAQPATLAPTSHTAPAVAAIPVHNSATAPALEGKAAEKPAAAALPGQGSAQSGPDQVFLAALQTIVQKGMAGGAQEALVILDSVLKMRSGNSNVLSAATAMGSAPLAHADGAMPGSEATAAPNSLTPATPSPPPALPPNGPGLQALPESVVAEDAGQLARKTWANSVTHPKEWISFKRFSEKNSETCATVCQAFAPASQRMIMRFNQDIGGICFVLWCKFRHFNFDSELVSMSRKGGDARLLMFQKWLLAEGPGLSQ